MKNCKDKKLSKGEIKQIVNQGLKGLLGGELLSKKVRAVVDQYLYGSTKERKCILEILRAEYENTGKAVYGGTRATTVELDRYFTYAVQRVWSRLEVGHRSNKTNSKKYYDLRHLMKTIYSLSEELTGEKKSINISERSGGNINNPDSYMFHITKYRTKKATDGNFDSLEELVKVGKVTPELIVRVCELAIKFNQAVVKGDKVKLKWCVELLFDLGLIARHAASFRLLYWITIMLDDSLDSKEGLLEEREILNRLVTFLDKHITNSYGSNNFDNPLRFINDRNFSMDEYIKENFVVCKPSTQGQLPTYVVKRILVPGPTNLNNGLNNKIVTPELVVAVGPILQSVFAGGYARTPESAAGALDHAFSSLRWSAKTKEAKTNLAKLVDVTIKCIEQKAIPGNPLRATAWGVIIGDLKSLMEEEIKDFTELVSDISDNNVLEIMLDDGFSLDEYKDKNFVEEPANGPDGNFYASLLPGNEIKMHAPRADLIGFTEAINYGELTPKVFLYTGWLFNTVDSYGKYSNPEGVGELLLKVFNYLNLKVEDGKPMEILSKILSTTVKIVKGFRNKCSDEKAAKWDDVIEKLIAINNSIKPQPKSLEQVLDDSNEMDIFTNSDFSFYHFIYRNYKDGHNNVLHCGHADELVNDLKSIDLSGLVTKAEKETEVETKEPEELIYSVTINGCHVITTKGHKDRYVVLKQELNSTVHTVYGEYRPTPLSEPTQPMPKIVKYLYENAIEDKESSLAIIKQLLLSEVKPYGVLNFTYTNKYT